MKEVAAGAAFEWLRLTTAFKVAKDEGWVYSDIVLGSLI